MRQTLNLDKRQRAMLREMDVRVWQPMAPATALPAATATPPARPCLGVPDSVAPPAIAIKEIASSPRISYPEGKLLPQLAAAQPPLPVQEDVRSDSGAVSWSVGNALALYAQAKPAPGPRWLILAEIPAAVVPPETAASNSSFNPFDGDAGKLLDNMLRAVRLHQTGTALLAPLVRRVGLEATPDVGFSVALATLMQAVQPDVVLVMGRLAAQSLLQSSEPFGKLRGQVHTLHGAPTIVTHDATYLLRSPLEKAKAWEDLCLAMRVV